jgi:hypothetical protein
MEFVFDRDRRGSAFWRNITGVTHWIEKSLHGEDQDG